MSSDFLSMNLASKSSGNYEKTEYFRIKSDGQVRVRVITEPEKFYTKFNPGGKPERDWNYFDKSSGKFLVHIIDRLDGKVKLYEMPKTIAEQIIALAKDEDFTFNSFPMPYDVKINVTNAGTKEVVYQVMASVKHEPLTELELSETSKIDSPAKILEKMIGYPKASPKPRTEQESSFERQKKELHSEGAAWTDEYGNVNEIPF